MVLGDILKEIAVNIGSNITIPCPLHQARDVMWVREGREDQQHHRMSVLEDGALYIAQADRNDTGVYACSRENVVNSDVKAKIKLFVRSKYRKSFNNVLQVLFYRYSHGF